MGNKIFAICLFSICMIICSYIFSIGIRNRNKAENIVSVTGLAERNFESDLIVWQSRISVKEKDLIGAYSELKKQTNAVHEFLLSKGLSEEEFTFLAVGIEKDYEYVYSKETGTSSSVFKGYRLIQEIKVSSGDIEKIELVSREISELIKRGIEINSFPPSFYYTKLADLKIELLSEAAKDGNLRANAIVSNGKGRLGRLVKSSQGVFQIIAQNSSEDYSWGGTFNTSSKKKTATVTVRMQYLLK